MLALSPTEWVVLGVGLIAIVIAVFVPMDSRGKGILGGLGAVAVVGIIVFSGSTSTQPQTIATPGAHVDITNLANVQGMSVVNSTNDIMQVAAQVVAANGSFYGGAPASGIAKFHFYLQRTDQGTNAAVFTVNLASNPSIYNATNSKSYYLIQQYSGNKTNEVTIAGSTGGQSLVSVPSAGSVEVNVSMTLNGYAITSMQLYGQTTLDFQVSLGGAVQQNVQVNVVFAKSL